MHMNRTVVGMLSLVLALSAATAADPVSEWFPGMNRPPKVVPALPEGYGIVPYPSPAGKGFDLKEGVFWTGGETLKQFGEGTFTNPKDAYFYVRISTNVKQEPGTDDFSGEADLVANFTKAGHKNVKSSKLRWGKYPVLSLTGEKADKSEFFFAWIGVNSPDGWAIVADFRTPRGEGHPTKAEREIWETFLSKTKPPERK